MISLMYSQSRLFTAAIFFFFCILIPLLEMKRAIYKAMGYQPEAEECPQVTAYLSVSKFEDLDNYSSSKVEKICSICLMEFEKEDVVSRLTRCCHLFHADCIERWLDCNQFTCPVCRSFFLVNLKSCHAKCGLMNSSY